MTKIDFYILGSSDPVDRLHLVCKLIHKAISRGQRVFVHSDDHALLEQLDECLWHFKPDRFIAHRLLAASDSSGRSAAATKGSIKDVCKEAVGDSHPGSNTRPNQTAYPALIGHAQSGLGAGDEAVPEEDADGVESVLLSSSVPTRTDAVFVNLARTVPVFFSRFERTLEVVDQQECIRLDGRERYRFYKERGYPLQHHHL